MDRRRLKEAVQLDRRGKELFDRGNAIEAVPLLRQSEIRKDLLGERTSDYVVGLLNLGLGAKNQSKTDEAIECYTAAHEYLTGDLWHLSPRPGIELDLHGGRGSKDQGRHAEARRHLERALAIYQTLYTKQSYPRGHFLMGDVLTGSGASSVRANVS